MTLPLPPGSGNMARKLFTKPSASRSSGSKPSASKASASKASASKTSAQPAQNQLAVYQPNTFQPNTLAAYQPYGMAVVPTSTGLLGRVQAAVSAFFGKAQQTTEGGVAGSASPIVSGYGRQQQVWDRRRVIAEIWGLYYSDPRFHAAVEKHCQKAVAAGFLPQVTARPGTSGVSVRRAQVETEEMLRRTGLLGPDGQPNLRLLTKYLRHGRIEADLFLQRVIAWGETPGSTEIIALKVMPSAGMERLSDDCDHFPDPSRAFVQTDVNTNQPVRNADGSPAYFEDWRIGHHRWKQVGEDRYGQFEYAGARKAALSLNNLEAFQEVRRSSNASRIEEHTLGIDGNSTITQKDIDDYKKNIAVTGDAAAVTTNPYEQLKKFVHDANVEIKVHPGDPSVHEIADLEYFLEKEGVANGTPIQLLGMQLRNVPRDTLDLVVSEWLESMAYDLAWVYEIILEVICLQLRLKGLDPLAFNISLAVPSRVFETATEAVAFVGKAMTNTLGAGMNAKPYPLLTAETAVSVLKEYIGIADAEEYVKKLEAMMSDKHIDADTVHEMQQMGADPGVSNGAANSKTGGSGTPGSGAKTGYGDKMEGGKLKPGVSGKASGEGYQKKA